MDGNITAYVILTPSFFLLFLLMAALLEKRKRPIQTFPGKKIPRLMKVNRDTVTKGLAVAGFILFSRRLIYYVPFGGVIQTKFSIWWVDGKAQTLLFISIFVLFVIELVYQRLKKEIEKEGCGLTLIGISIFFIFLLFVMRFKSADLKFEIFITERYLILIIFAPLVLLKMFCSGKYLGFFTSFLLGYFITARYKKLTPGSSKVHVKILIAVLLMFLIFLGFTFYQSLGNKGNWEQRLNNKVLSVTSESDMMDLLDAVNSINQEQARYETLKRIVALIVKEEDFRWKKEIYQQVIDAVLTFYGHRRISLLKKIALWIAKNGDGPWAISVAENISFKGTRNNLLKEIRQRTEKQ